MANNFKRFQDGVQISGGFATDPTSGRVGEIYWNTTLKMFRMCVDVTPTWRNVSLSDGTITGSMIRWNDATKMWEENVSLLTGSYILVGAPDLVDDANPASDLTITAPNKTLGTGDGGNLLLGAGLSAGGNKGDVKLDAYRVNIGAIHAIDPASGSQADVIYNSTQKQLKFHDGTIWRSIGSGGGLIKVRLIDPISILLPIGNPVVIDSLNVVADDLVLFTSLSSGANEIYKAVGTGIDITGWTAELVFDGSTTPIDGDTVIVTEGLSFADQIGKFDGTSWLFNDKTRFFNGQDYWELSSLMSTSILDNQSTPQNIFSIPYLGSENIIVDYSIMRGSTKETGSIFITTNGTDVALSTAGSSVGATGVSFSAVINGSDIELQYTSDAMGSTGQMKWFVKRWSDASGGPAGLPSYTGGGGSGITGSGTAPRLAFWSGGSSITSNASFTVDTVNSALKLGDAEHQALSYDSIPSGAFTDSLLFTFPSAYNFMIVEYSVERGTDFRLGTLWITQNGSSINVVDNYSEVGTTNLLFASPVVTHTFSGSNVEIRYTSTGGSTGQFQKLIRRW